MWLCWIPILTPDVDYPRRLIGFVERQGSEFVDGAYTFSIPLSDVKDDKASTVKIYTAFVAGQVASIEIDGIFEIEITRLLPNGLILFSFKNQFEDLEDESHAAKQVYVILKHIYHEHTHHHQDDDMLLLPERIDSESEIRRGIKGIVTQYIEKIITYHRTLKRSFFYSARDADNILTEFNKGLGEMLYAKHFLDLNESYLESQYIKRAKISFQSSLDSFNQMLSVFNSRLEKKNVDIAYAVVILTVFIILMGGVSPFFKNKPVGNLFLHLILIFLFLGCYKWFTRPKR